VVVDSGANIGQMLVSLVGFVPQGRYLAVEPCAAAADWLATCLVQHPDLPVELVRVALGEREGSASLTQSEGAHGLWSTLSLTPPPDARTSIHVVRLADELTQRSIPRVDLWKLDVEGHEVPALKGALPLLEQKRIQAIYAELVGANGPRVIRLLEELGYAPHYFDRRNRLQPLRLDRGFQLPRWMNSLFLPEAVIPSVAAHA